MAGSLDLGSWVWAGDRSLELALWLFGVGKVTVEVRGQKRTKE